MAELVDALVSNTNAARRAGSIPALGTKKGRLGFLPIVLSLLAQLFQFFFVVFVPVVEGVHGLRCALREPFVEDAPRLFP